MFENTFVPSDDPTAKNKADPQLIKKLTTPQELSGWLNLGLAYLPVLLKEGFAQEPIDQVKLEYEKKADQVSRYVQKYCVIDGSKKDFYTSSKTVYNHYLKVCENDNIKPLDENVFGSRLVEHGISHKRKRVKGNSRDREYVYEPLRLRHELQEEQDTITNNSNSGLFVSSAGIPADSTDQSTNVKELSECIHCALPGISRPIFRTNNTRDYQLHYVFRHPEVDLNEVTEE
jgi:phage/plasmid-associated DNA primase